MWGIYPSVFTNNLAVHDGTECHAIHAWSVFQSIFAKIYTQVYYLWNERYLCDNTSRNRLKHEETARFATGHILKVTLVWRYFVLRFQWSLGYLSTLGAIKKSRQFETVGAKPCWLFPCFWLHCQWLNSPISFHCFNLSELLAQTIFFAYPWISLHPAKA